MALAIGFGGLAAAVDRGSESTGAVLWDPRIEFVAETSDAAADAPVGTTAIEAPFVADVVVPEPEVVDPPALPAPEESPAPLPEPAAKTVVASLLRPETSLAFARVRPSRGAAPTPAAPPPAPAAAAAPGPASPSRSVPAAFARVADRRAPAPYASNPTPGYPFAARRDGREGAVRLRIQVSAEGLVTDVAIEASSGHGDLDAAASAAAWAWRYVPATVGDRPEAAEVRQTVRFVLDR